MQTEFTRQAGIRYPLICGAMYPCSNAELIAAVSEAGGIGIVQPISMQYVYKMDLRQGLRLIRQLTSKPYGFNVLTEASSKMYLERMRKWVGIALEEGCRFFISAMGDPRWIVDLVKPKGGIVYHDVTELKFAEKGLKAGVDGLICVNSHAGGHSGTYDPAAMFEKLKGFGVPLICAGGVGDAAGFVGALNIGYSGVQLGTRFIASDECGVHPDYKAAILKAEPDQIVRTERLSGVPVSVIRTPYVEKMGTKAGPLAKWMLSHPRLKRPMRLFYSLSSLKSLKKGSLGGGYSNYWPAGKSVGGIQSVEPAAVITERLGSAWLESQSA
jgi:nitronate monooxygenase